MGKKGTTNGGDAHEQHTQTVLRTDRQTDRQTDTHTHTHSQAGRHTHTHTQTDAQTHNHNYNYNCATNDTHTLELGGHGQGSVVNSALGAC